MTIKANKCNVSGCAGHILYDIDGLENKQPIEKDGLHVYDTPACSECGKAYALISHPTLVDVQPNGDTSFPRSASMIDVTLRQKWVVVENETDPLKKIEAFIALHGFSYRAADILTSYQEYYLQDAYVSHTMKQCINYLKPELATLVAKGH